MKDAPLDSQIDGGLSSTLIMELSSEGIKHSLPALATSVTEALLSAAGMEDTAGGEVGTSGSDGGGGVPSDEVFPEEGSPDAVTLLGVARECVGEPRMEDAPEFVGEQYLARMCRNGSADLRLNTVTCLGSWRRR